VAGNCDRLALRLFLVASKGLGEFRSGNGHSWQNPQVTSSRRSGRSEIPLAAPAPSGADDGDRGGGHDVGRAGTYVKMKAAVGGGLAQEISRMVRGRSRQL
jgi:hypothetical protein